MSRSVFLFVALATASAGCVRYLGQAATDRDGAQSVLPTDLSRGDVHHSDDMGREARGARDPLSDLARKDKPPPLNPCATTPGVVEESVSALWSPTMKVCLKNGNFDQCTAKSLCHESAGWSMCTASQYRARGGTLTGTQSNLAWLRACVRVGGGSPTAPVDQVCSATCSPSTSSSTTVSWTCSGLPFAEFPDANVGLHTAPNCSYVGVMQPGTSAYWAARPDSDGVGVSRAVCCSP